MTAPLILSFCDRTGIWSDPYRNAGYDVQRVDIRDGHDVRILPYVDRKVYGIISQPPCDHLAGSGARWWEQKGDKALLEALELVMACLGRIAVYDNRDQLNFWVLENPVGRLSRFIGPAAMTYDPCDYGGYLAPPGDAYTKRTCLWGRFYPPIPRPVLPTEGSKMHLLPPSTDRKDLRSMTPEGFAQAFFEANHHPVYREVPLFDAA